MNESAEIAPRAWFAVLCKPRAEGLARKHLERQQFPCLLPLVMRQRRTGRGLDQRIEPLFPRYLFIETDADGRQLAPVRSTRGVSGLVRFGERAARVPEELAHGGLSGHRGDVFFELLEPRGADDRAADMRWRLVCDTRLEVDRARAPPARGHHPARSDHALACGGGGSCRVR